MKKLTLIASIAIVVLSSSAKAQTIVSACGKTVKLNSKQVALLHSYRIPAIDSALKTCTSIKYNSTADMIIGILESKRQRKDYIATNK